MGGPHFLTHEFRQFAAQCCRVLVHALLDFPESQFDLPSLHVVRSDLAPENGAHRTGRSGTAMAFTNHAFDEPCLPVRWQIRALLACLRRNRKAD